MTHTVEQMARDIVAREGGYVNDPADPGGATKYGVTIHTMRDLGLDLDRDGDVDVADVRLMTVDRAAAIFMEHYFHRPRIADLPAILHDTVFDMYVNAGGNAVRILQRLATKMGFPTTADGVIGPDTIRRVTAAAERAPEYIRDAYGIERRNYYFALADRRPAMRKFARARDGGKGGWIRRAETFISPRHHMSDDEFQMRVSKWP